MGSIISRPKHSHDDSSSLQDSYDHGRKGRSASEPKQLSKSSSKKKNDSSASSSSSKNHHETSTKKHEEGPPSSLKLSARRYSQHLDSTIKQLEDELKSNHSLADDGDYHEHQDDNETSSQMSMGSRTSRRRAKSELISSTSLKQLEIPVGITPKPPSITTEGMSIEDAYKQILMSSSLGKSHEEILHRTPASKMKVPITSTRKGPRDDKDTIIKDQMRKAKASRDDSKKKSSSKGMPKSSSRSNLEQPVSSKPKLETGTGTSKSRSQLEFSKIDKSSKVSQPSSASTNVINGTNHSLEINSKLLASQHSTSSIQQNQSIPIPDQNIVLTPLSNKKKKRKKLADEQATDSGFQITVLTPDEREVSAQSKPHLKWQEQKKRSQVKLKASKQSDEDLLAVGSKKKKVKIRSADNTEMIIVK